MIEQSWRTVKERKLYKKKVQTNAFVTHPAWCVVSQDET